MGGENAMEETMLNMFKVSLGAVAGLLMLSGCAYDAYYHPYGYYAYGPYGYTYYNRYAYYPYYRPYVYRPYAFNGYYGRYYGPVVALQ